MIEHRDHAGHGRREVDRLRHRLEVARLELGDDQLALDQAEQAVRRLVRLLQECAPSCGIDGLVPLHDPGERVLHRRGWAAHLVSDRAQHQIFRFQSLPLRGHVFVEREHARGLALESGDDHSPHVHCAVGILHPQLEGAVGVGHLGRDRPGRGIDLIRLAARHLGSLQAVDGFDLRVRVHDVATRILEQHADRRVPQDRVHHPSLAVECVDELELAEEHGGLAGQHAGESSSLRGPHRHARHQQSREPAFDLDRDGERVLRRAEEVEKRAQASATGGRRERTQQLGAVGHGHPRRGLLVVRAPDQLTVLEQPELALRPGERAVHEPRHLRAGAVRFGRRQLGERRHGFEGADAAASLGDQSRVLDRDRRVARKVQRGRAGFRDQGGPMDGADRADQAVAVPQRDQVPGVVAGNPADDARRCHAVVGAQAGPAEHLLSPGLTAGTRRGHATVSVECPARGAGGFEHRPRLVGDVGDHAHQLVAGEGCELLDAHRLRERQLVRVVEAHRPERDAHHRHRGLEELEMRGLEAAAVVAHGDEAGDDAVVLGDRRPHDVGRRALEDVAADRPAEVRRLVGHRVQHLVAPLDHAAEKGSVFDRHRADRGRRLAGRARETRDEARHVDICEHRVRRSHVVGDHREHRLRKLALVGRARDAHLEHVQGFEACALGLGLGEVVGVGQRQADVSGHVLQQRHVPFVKRAFGVGLEREHGRDPLAAEHRHPHERARDPAAA